MSVRRNTLFLVSAISLLSGGCTALAPLQGSAPPRDAPNAAVTRPVAATTPAEQLAAMRNPERLDIRWLFHYYRLAATAPGKSLSDEYERAKGEYEVNKTTQNKWRLAVLLSIPGAPFYDAERSSTLLKELTNSGSGQDPLLNEAAFLMYSLLNEQNHIGRKSDDLAQQLAESQSLNKKLQDQLNALKAIENTLYKRNKAEDNPTP